MRGLGANQIVASVVRWSHHYVMFSQRFECFFENKTREVWAVAVEGNGAPLTFCELRKHRSETGGKTLTFLRNYARFPACHKRKLVHVRLRAHDCHFYVAQRPRQRQCVVQKTAIEIKYSFRRKARRKASLDRAWLRCFRHDYQYTIFPRRSHHRLSRAFHRSNSTTLHWVWRLFDAGNNSARSS